MASATGLRSGDIDSDSSFFSLGLTSLDAVELARALADFAQLELPATVAWDFPTVERLTAHCMRSGSTQETAAPHPSAAEAIAIVGIGCRFPGAAGPAAFFEMLCRGDDPLTDVPPERWAVDDYFSAELSAPAKMVSRRGGFLPGLDGFDAAFFRMSPREAAHLDPRQRLMLEAAWEAFEDAGLPPLDLAGSDTGVFVATLASNYGSLLFDRHLELVDAYSGTGNGNSVTANRLSYFFDLRGPSLAVDTACSGSLVALHLACRSLKSGETGLALVGGVNVILKPDDSVFFSKTGALSPDGVCRVFDRKANGIVRSDGAGCIVLRRLSDAQAAGDRVYAVIHGTAVNQDGATNGLMAPNGVAQQQLLRRAYAAAGIAPAAVQYIEAHGTGTALGDPIEVGALSAVLGEDRPPGTRCALGSVKSNIGHTEAAAGMAGVIKAASAIHQQRIPGNRHYDEPNPLIPFDRIPLFVQERTAPWPQPAEPLVAGVSAFGFAGTNAHVVLGPSPPVPDRLTDDEPAHVLAISARSDHSLRALASSYADGCDDTAGFAALCHASMTQRSHLEHRLSMAEADPVRARERLRAFAATGRTAAGLHHGVTRLDRAVPIGLLFSGQGSHWPGMGRRLFAMQPVFRQIIEECDELFRRDAGRSLIAELARDAVDSRLDDTAVGQPAIFAVQAGLFALLRSWGITPAFALGQSLGEAAAAFAAGALSLPDAFRVVRVRSQLMAKVAGLGRTAVVGLSRDEVDERIQRSAGQLSIAGTLSPALTLISGPVAPTDAWMAALTDAGVFARVLPVDVALHSATQMDPLRADLLDGLHAIAPRATTVPFISSLTGGEVPGEELGPEYWFRNLRDPYRFDAAFAHAQGLGCHHFIEVSPHPLLLAATTAMRDGTSGCCVGSLHRHADPRQALLGSLAEVHAAGVAVDWPAVLGGRGTVVPLPRYAWRRERYWYDQLAATGRPDTPRSSTTVAASTGASLLGSPVRVSVSVGTHIWESRLGPDRPALFAHHAVQDTVVVPAAAYVQLALDASRIVDPSGPPPRLDGLRLASGLTLSSERVLQTVAERDGQKLRVRFLSSPVDGTEWTLHAEATCAPGTLSLGVALSPDAKLIGVAERPIEQHYDAMAMRGLQYSGPFRALARIWTFPGGAVGLLQRVIASGSTPETASLDPALLDGCLQLAAAASDGSTDLRLPALIEAVDCPTPLPDVFWCYAEARPPDPARPERFVVDQTMVDAQGVVIARVHGAAFDRVGASNAAVRDDIRRWMYEVEWRPAPLLTPSRLPALDDVVAAFAGQAGPLAASLGLDHYADLWPAFDRLARACVLEALPALGVPLDADQALTTEAIAEQAGVAPQHRRLLSRLLEMLREDGVLSTDGRLRPAFAPDPSARIAEDIQRRFPAADAELGLVQRGGSRLAALLTGRADPLEVLFAGDGDDLLERLYRDSVFMRFYNRAIRDAVVAAQGAVAPTRPLRVLEIGGGTGATTQHVLPALQGRPYEYVFTDLSPRLVDLARAKFSRYASVSYEVLDIEVPGAIEAGSFDVVIAANVLHATADLRQSLDQARRLLAPGGWLILLEGHGRQRWLDLIVGATDGWWRFRDDVRTDYPLVDPHTWTRALHGSGFDDVRTIVDPTPRPPQMVMVARAMPVDAAVREYRWLLASPDPAASAPLNSYLASAGADVRSVTPTMIPRQELRDAIAAPGRPWRVVYMGGLATALSPALTSEDFDHLESHSLFPAIELVQLLASQAQPSRIWLVTRGAVPVDSAAPLAVAQAPMWGIGRVVASEHPELFGGLADLDPDARSNNAEQLLLEILAGSDDNQIALRGDARLVARMIPLRSSVTPARWSLRRDAAYLITGGVRGIGLAVAARLIERGARHLILLSRTCLPPRAAWRSLAADDSGYEAVQGVLHLEALGAEVVSIAADIGDGSLRDVLASYDAEARPPIRGVVHSAGLIEDHLMVRMDAAAFARVTRPKIRGAWLLHDALATRELDFFILFSSGTSLLGTFGQANYAAGNAFLDALAHYRRQQQLPATVINWGVWQRIGIVARRGREEVLAQNGLLEIEPSRGLDALEYVHGLGLTQVAAMPTDWSVWRQAHPGFDRLRFFGELHSQDAGHIHRAAATDAGSRDHLERLRQADGASRPDAAVAYVSAVVGAALGIEAERLDPQAPLPTLGLDSIMAIEIRNRIDSDLGVSVSIVDLLNGLTAAEMADRISSMPPTDRGPAMSIRQGAAAAVPDATAPGPVLQPCTPGQRTLWHTELLNDRRAPVYNVAVEVELGEAVDPDTLRDALRTVITRHQPLRTGFVERAGEPVQRILPDVVPDLRVQALPEMEDWERLAHGAATDLAAEPFDLDADSLARFLLVTGRDRALFALSVHHLVFDGWSAGILVRELATCYDAIAAGRDPQLPPLLTTYGDFAREWGDDDRGDAAAIDLDYWSRTLAGRWQPLELPLDGPRPKLPSFVGAKMPVACGPDVAANLRRLSRHEGVTPFVTLASALGLTLHLESGQREFVLGVTPSQRERHELSLLIGYFVTMLPLPLVFDDEEPFAATLARVRRTTVEAFAHQAAVIEDIQQAVRESSGSRVPGVQVVFTLQNSPITLPPIVRGYRTLDNRTAKFELVLNLIDGDHQIEGWWEFRADLFRPDTIERLSRRFLSILALVVENPGLTASELRSRTGTAAAVVPAVDEFRFPAPPVLDA